MIAIVDYGVGNLFSLRSSLLAVGAETVVTADPLVLRAADKIILPGVGAFGDAAEKLRRTGLGALVKEEAGKGKPLLGICLGMQLLLEKSYEYGEHEGLGLLKGQVVPFAGKLRPDLKIPLMGWNALEVRQGRLLDVVIGQYVYFVHSFYAENCADSLSAVTEYDIPITAAVEKGNIFGCQFHPEKSGKVGLSILESFCRM